MIKSYHNTEIIVWGKTYCPSCFNCMTKTFTDWDDFLSWLNNKNIEQKKTWIRIFKRKKASMDIYWCKKMKDVKVLFREPNENPTDNKCWYLDEG